MKREVMIKLLAPEAPPCFSTRDVWVSFCATAASDQKKFDAARADGPLIFTRVLDPEDIPPSEVPVVFSDGNQVRFNPRFRYCAECLFEHRDRMRGAGKCKPEFVRDAITDKAKT